MYWQIESKISSALIEISQRSPLLVCIFYLAIIPRMKSQEIIDRSGHNVPYYSFLFDSSSWNFGACDQLPLLFAVGESAYVLIFAVLQP